MFFFSKHLFLLSTISLSPGCFIVPDGQLLILAIRDNGVRLYLYAPGFVPAISNPGHAWCNMIPVLVPRGLHANDRTRDII